MNYEFTINKEAFITAPTQQMAMAWLREKGVFISIEPYVDDFRIVWSVYIKDCGLNWVKKKHDESPFYEEAVEAAIKYSLENLI